MLTASAETLAKRFHDRLGYWPDIENPRTLQEKILWRKLHEDMSEAARLADKVAVRDYVRELVGEEYLVEALAIAENADELDFDSLPRSFILKVNHASSANLVVEDRSVLDVSAVRRLLNSLLRLQYGRRLGEHWYSAIPPRILVERLLVDPVNGRPVEYRFHVFHGKAEFFQVVTSRGIANQFPGWSQTMEGFFYVDGSTAVHRVYGMDWQPAPFHFNGATDLSPPLDHTPAVADEMVAVAEKLAGDWGYVRVDLYCVNDMEVYFGELTFAHNAGLFGLVPKSYNEYFGSLWDIHRRFVRAG